MQLENESNIHTTSEDDAPPADWKPRYQKVKRSPMEEMTARVERFSAPEPIPESLAALMLQSQRYATVQPNGISFDDNGSTFRFFHPESTTCVTRVGERVLFSYDKDNLDVIYLLSSDGRFQEALPRDKKVDWFDKDMEQQIAKYRSVTQHAHDALKKTHGKTTHRIHDRTKANAEAVPALNYFPIPKEVRAKWDESEQDKGRVPSSKSRMDNVDNLTAAQDGVRKMKTDHVERGKRLDSVRVTREDMATATRGEIESDDDTEISLEDITAALSDK